MTPYTEKLRNAYESLGCDPNPNLDDLRHALVANGVYTTRLAQAEIEYRVRYGSLPDVYATQGTWTAAFGSSVGTTKFRSEYEKRTSEALTKLGVTWTYERVRYEWLDSKGRPHLYTPDFNLTQFSDLHVEVKGPSGPSTVDRYKMDRAVSQNRHLTLLLWDASVIDMVEDVTDPIAIVGLINTTRVTT